METIYRIVLREFEKIDWSKLSDYDRKELEKAVLLERHDELELELKRLALI